MDSKVASGSGVTVDTAMSGTSTNPVQNKVIKQYVDGKVAAAGSNITVDATLSSTSTNPVQNKAVKAAIDAKADKTALDAKADKTALNAKMDKSGGTFTGNVHGKYFAVHGYSPQRLAIWGVYRARSPCWMTAAGCTIARPPNCLLILGLPTQLNPTLTLQS